VCLLLVGHIEATAGVTLRMRGLFHKLFEISICAFLFHLVNFKKGKKVRPNCPQATLT